MKNDYHLQRLYQKYNKLYFDNQLPQATIGWDEKLDELPEDEKLHGLAFVLDITKEADGTTHRVATIHLSSDLKNSDLLKYATILHEMIHIKLFPFMKHGRRFNNEVRRLASLGAYDGVL